MICAVLNIVKTESHFVIAPVAGSKCLDVHYHVAVPVGPEGHCICLVAVLVLGADLLHAYEQVVEIVHIVKLGISQLLVKIPAEIHGVEECFMILGRSCNVVAEAEELVACAEGIIELHIVLDSVGHILLDVGAVVGEDIVLVPVEEEAALCSSLVVIAVGTEDNDVSQIA